MILAVVTGLVWYPARWIRRLGRLVGQVVAWGGAVVLFYAWRLQLFGVVAAILVVACHRDLLEPPLGH